MAAQRPVRTVLVDDHPVVLDGVRAVLAHEPDIEVVGTATSGEAAIELLKTVRADVVVLDVSLPDVNGIELCRTITHAPDPPAVLFLTIHQGETYFFQALKAGALGYVPKTAPSEELVHAIRCTARGEAYLHPTVARFLVGSYLENFLGSGTSDTLATLTDREREVLRLVAEGKTTKEIAEELHLSANTVHNHRANVMSKLGLHSRLDLLRFALRYGLIDLGDTDAVLRD